MTLNIFLAIGTLLMAGVMLLCNEYYGIDKRKLAASALILLAVALFGAKLMYLIENGSWGGVSFFGSLFFAPLLMLVAARLLKIPGGDMLDLCAVAVCVMLALLKIHCLTARCCGGMVIRYTESGAAVHFPSQIIECASALLIGLFLYWEMGKGSRRGKIYPIFMVVYGLVRFALNLLRETSPFLFGLPVGNFWSLVSIAAGVVVLIVIKKKARSA